MLVFKTQWQRANWLPVCSSHYNRKNALSRKLPSLQAPGQQEAKQHSPFLQSRAGTDGRTDRRTTEGATSRAERWVLALMRKNCNNPREIRGVGVLLALAAPSKMD